MPLAAPSRRLALLAGLSLLTACASGPRREAPQFDLPLSRLPLQDVHVDWKERLPQRYVFREIVGDYRIAPDALDKLLESAYGFGLRPAGPPFVLYYDDPGRVPIEQLRARVCLPVAGTSEVTGPWQYDVLPSGTVAYAFVQAPRSAVALSYAGILAWLHENGWQPAGPIREIYALDGTGAALPVTEVQIPWASGESDASSP